MSGALDCTRASLSPLQKPRELKLHSRLLSVSMRLKQVASTTDDYEEQIALAALAAALKSLKFLEER